MKKEKPKKRVTITEFRVVSGPSSYSGWLPAKNITHARQLVRECRKQNPHQGGGYSVVKVTHVKTEKIVS